MHEDRDMWIACGRGRASEEWIRLMREGVGIGDRDLGAMTRAALDRFAYFTDEEVAALRAFLLAGAR